MIAFLLASALASEGVPVVVASKEIPAGRMLAYDVEVVSLPGSLVPEHTFSDAKDVLQRVAKERILAGEIVREERLAHPESGLGPGSIVRKGQHLLDWPLMFTAQRPLPGDVVDLVRLDGDGLCVVEQAVAVLWMRVAGGTVTSERVRGTFDTAYLALAPKQVRRVLTWPDTVMLLRDSTDKGVLDARACELPARD